MGGRYVHRPHLGLGQAVRAKAAMIHGQGNGPSPVCGEDLPEFGIAGILYAIAAAAAEELNDEAGEYSEPAPTTICSGSAAIPR